MALTAQIKREQEILGFEWISKPLMASGLKNGIVELWFFGDVALSYLPSLTLSTRFFRAYFGFVTFLYNNWIVQQAPPVQSNRRLSMCTLMQ